MSAPRRNELHRIRARRAKLAKLRERYNEAKTQEEKAKIVEKTARVSPTAKIP